MHSHYWLSGQVGWLAAERWGVPLVHSMHTMAKVKNLTLAEGDAPEPAARVIGEAQVVDGRRPAGRQHRRGGRQLVELYDADPDRVAVVPPGVDLELFSPGLAAAARRRLGVADRRVPCCCSSAASSRSRRPTCCCARPPGSSRPRPALRDRLVVAVVGGPSGSGLAHPESLQCWPPQLGLADLVRFVPPGPAGRAAGLVPRRRPHRRAVVQRVVRPGRDRVAGLRHAGRRGRGRRAAHRGRRRGLRRAGRRPRPRRLRRASSATCATDPDRRAAAEPRRAAARRPVRLGGDRGRACSRSTAEALLEREERPAARRRTGDARARHRSATSCAAPLAELELEEPTPGTFVVVLPGSSKLKTTCQPGRRRAQPVGERVRLPAPGREPRGRLPLAARAQHRLYAVAFAVDHLGDVYLIGRLPLHAVTPDEVDRLLGAVLERPTASFNTILELGFASAIRKEWAWRARAASRPGTWRRSATSSQARRPNSG